MPPDERRPVGPEAAVGQRRAAVARGQVREAVPGLLAPRDQARLHRQRELQLAPGVVLVLVSVLPRFVPR